MASLLSHRPEESTKIESTKGILGPLSPFLHEAEAIWVHLDTPTSQRESYPEAEGFTFSHLIQKSPLVEKIGFKVII